VSYRSGGQEDSGQADEDEHPDHARENQDDYRAGFHGYHRIRSWRPQRVASTVDGGPATPLKRPWNGPDPQSYKPRLCRADNKFVCHPGPGEFSVLGKKPCPGFTHSHKNRER